MSPALSTLTPKEKETLRLLLAGHDAKSMARHLHLSVHTVNERLRDARRKLGVSSSREAARLLREAEDARPQYVGDEGLGGAAAPPPGPHHAASTAGKSFRRAAAWSIGGFAMLTLTLALFALSPAAEAPSSPGADTARPAQTAAANAALAFLRQIDARDWAGSYAATGASFRTLNTLAVWTAASQKARAPLGALVSRTLLSDEEIPPRPAVRTSSSSGRVMRTGPKRWRR